VNKNLFLSTLKIFRFSDSKDPELVREILCESNKNPAMDYGPSVVYYNKALYYFKRLHDTRIYLQLFKFDLEHSSESMIKGYRFTEALNKETKI